MVNTKIIKESSGVTLIELLVTLSIIGILSVVGIPEYGRFIAKNNVRSASSDLLQNMRLAKTMAIKENETYLVIFDYAANIYHIGVDMDGNNSLLDAVDEYGGTSPARTIDPQSDFGNNIVFGSTNFTTVPPNGPEWTTISNAASFQFNPDGSASPSGTVYFQHNNTDRGYTFCVELANSAGTIDLYMWQGHSGNTGETIWTEIR